LSKVRLADRRVVFVVSMTAALVLVLALGAGGASAGKTVACANDSGVINATTVTAKWCWDSSYDLTYVGISKTQADVANGGIFGGLFWTSDGITLENESGGDGDTTKSQNFVSAWFNSLATAIWHDCLFIKLEAGNTSMIFKQNGGYFQGQYSEASCAKDLFP
jgi:hypothetical protein